VPFEAAGVGVPCFFAPVTSMGELWPAEAALIEPWDPTITAGRIARVLSDPEARERHVQVLRDTAAQYTWAATAETLLATYEEILREPINPARSSRIAGEHAGALAHELRVVYSSRSWQCTRPLRWLRRLILGPAS